MIVVNAGGLNLTVADPEHLIEEVLGLPVPPTGDLLLELPYVCGPSVLRSALDSAPARKPYYPGSDVRIAGAVASYPHAERVGDGPVCKLQLPERVSSGTQSTWVAGSELRRWSGN